MSDDPHGTEPSPVNALPPVVVALFLTIFGVEAMFAAAEAGFIGGPRAVGWRLGALQDYSFSPRVLAWMVENGTWPVEHLIRFVTYPFLHMNFTQMLFAAVILLAIGKMVGEVMGSGAVLVIFFGAGVIGALAFGLLFPDASVLTGAFPPVYGLIGGYTFILWARARALGRNPSNAFMLIAFLMGIQLVFGLLFGTDHTWVADLAGFFAGFALCFVIVPAARNALLDRLRQRR